MPLLARLPVSWQTRDMTFNLMNGERAPKTPTMRVYQSTLDGRLVTSRAAAATRRRCGSAWPRCNPS